VIFAILGVGIIAAVVYVYYRRVNARRYHHVKEVTTLHNSNGRPDLDLETTPVAIVPLNSPRPPQGKVVTLQDSFGLERENYELSDEQYDDPEMGNVSGTRQ